MTKTEIIARFDNKLRPILLKLPSYFVISLYSRSRKYFLKLLENEIIENLYSPSSDKKLNLWNLTFACGLFNAAGMFKNGGGYYTVAQQGAGAYLAGTTTYLPRSGNKKNGLLHPFMPYVHSGSASNWMGLPNQGHSAVAKTLSSIQKFKNCPVGISISASPEQKGKEELESIIDGMKLYELAEVDFIELNESCPNIPNESSGAEDSKLEKQFIDRLEYIKQNFLLKRKRFIPVIVKFSTDTTLEQTSELLDLLITLGFDGINLGNTSIDYSGLRSLISKSDLRSYDYFINKFGGGLSGRILKNKSLELCSFATDYIGRKNVSQEFYVIRTGGIDTKDDLNDSRKAGILLNQWFTGYFDNFSKYGHNLYREILENN